MKDKLYTIAGTSTVNGVNTLRVATGKIKVREGVLRRAGHTEIQLQELPRAMTRQEAAAWIAAQGIEAVVPVKGGGRVLELTPEQKAAAEAAAQKAAFVQRMAEARAAKKKARQEAMDHNFMAELTGGNKVPVPVLDEDEPVPDDDTALSQDATVSVAELLGAVIPEGGVDHEREVAEEITKQGD